MNLVDVLESGKKFRRKSWEVGEFIFADIINELVDHHDTVVELGYSEIIADDWEIYEEKIELTESQIRDAWGSMIKEPGFNLNLLIENLGFGK